MLLRCLILGLLTILVVQRQSPAQQILLEDVTDRSQLEFEHFSGRTGKHFLIETVTCGMATFDYDGDGLIDVYLPNGAPLLGGTHDPEPRNRLFKNLGDFRFRDVTEQAGVGDAGFAFGVVAGDFDNDGDSDIVVTNFGAPLLFENQGDGTFSRREFLKDSDKPRAGAGAAFLDIDGDGCLDLYVANYVDFSFDESVSRLIFGVPAAPGPLAYSPDKDCLYRNDGAGGFVDISRESGIGDVAGPGMGVVAFDYDEDQDTDIFVCNDSAANFLFENQGDGSFVETALIAGVAYDVTGARQASMGVDVADVDHDGHLDLVTTNFVDEVPTMYRNSGLGFFDDIGAASGLGRANRSVTWGVGLADLDNDSWDDCFICAGHLIQGVTRVNDADLFEAPNVALRNVSGRFTSDGVAGSALNDVDVSRGCALDDLDNDGRIDAVVLNLDSRAQVIRNASSTTSHFVAFQLIGVQANRDAAGSRIEVETEHGTLVKELVLGRGYQSHFGQRVHFGLGADHRIKQVKIYWMGGETQVIKELDADRTYTIIEGQDPR